MGSPFLVVHRFSGSSTWIPLLAVWAIGLLFPLTVAAQVRQDLDRFANCSECELVVVRDLTLRLEPPEFIETEHAWTNFNPADQRFYLVAGPTTIAVFDRQGRYLESFGSRGRGPGELEFIGDIRFDRGNTVILDTHQLRWSLRTRDGDQRSLGRVQRNALGFVVVAPDTAVTAAVAMTRERAGYPLQLTVMSSGEELRFFGSQSGDFNAALPWAQRVLIAPSARERAVWLARPRELRFEEWTVDGRLSHVAQGTPGWFPPVHRIPEFGSAPPPTRLRQFLIDARQRLWVISWVAARNWERAVLSARSTPEGEHFIDTAEYFATRLDVWDLQTETYYGSLVWEDDKVRLLQRNDDILVQRVELDATLEPVVALYRVAIRVPERR